MSSHLVRSVVSCRVSSSSKMLWIHWMSLTALDLLSGSARELLGRGYCVPQFRWMRGAEYNLLCQKALRFRKTKCVVKEGGLLVHSHSRQHTSGIRIPTSFAAVVGEWGNVRKQVSTWAWKGGSIVVAKKHAGSQRYNLLDKVWARLMYHYQDWKRYHQFIRPLLTVTLTFASIALTPHTVRLTPLAFDLDQ
jgi:hypothetical protein